MPPPVSLEREVGGQVEERLQKLIANAGLCSRRAAEDLLRQGRVMVNGERASLGQKADPERDQITVDGAPLVPRSSHTYLMLHKPPGYACTLSDPHAAHLVTELVADCGARVYPVGRLDVASEGLLLLTDDGDFAHALLHPRGQVDKTYRVTVSGYRPGCEARLAALRDLEGEPISPARVRLLSREGSRAELEVVIHQGKKRQIRRMCKAVGLAVTRLCRVGEGPLSLGDLPPGKWRYLTADEVAACKK